MLLTPEQILPNPVASPQGSGSAHLQPWRGLGGLVRGSHTSSPHSCPSSGPPLISSWSSSFPSWSSAAAWVTQGGELPLCLFFSPAHPRLLAATEQEIYGPQSYGGAPSTFFSLMYTPWGDLQGNPSPSLVFLLSDDHGAGVTSETACFLFLSSAPAPWVVAHPGRCRGMVSITRPQQTRP